ncbi:hypothetical protein GE09DRAFT_1056922 [Coniochaeta sp. 2T2.1]|nr:hypothetical protein GE09DRAFT_1056922 [Coniochaeta sp. 2T2.1]
MFQRIVSLGQARAPEDDEEPNESNEPMPTSSSEDAPHPEARGIGGLAGVLRNLTGSKKSPPPQLTLGNVSSMFPPDNAAAAAPKDELPPEHVVAFRQLRDGSINDRIAAAENLRLAVTDYPLASVLDIFHAGEDLIEQSKTDAARAAGWQLLDSCVKHQYSKDADRKTFFRVISAPANPKDFHLQLAAVEDLTRAGRELRGFEYDLFPLLTKWLHYAYNAKKASRKHHNSLLRSKSTKGRPAPTGEDHNFAHLFTFVEKVIKFNFKAADDNAIALLLDELCGICNDTTIEGDIRACIGVIDAIVTFGTIPEDRLKPCIDVLSSVHSMVRALEKDAWHTISNICKSHHGQSTVRICLDTLRGYQTVMDTGATAVRVVRGALSILQKLLAKSSEKNYPSVPLTLLADGLANVAMTKSRKVDRDILKLINSLLENADGGINALVIDEDWTTLFDVAAQCGEKAVEAVASGPESVTTVSKDNESEIDSEENVAYQLRLLITRVEQLVKLHKSDLLQRDECIKFLCAVHRALPDSAVSLVLDHFREHRSCYPTEIGWQKNVDLVIESFFLNHDLLSLTRLQALAAIRELHEFAQFAPEDLVEANMVVDLLRRVLADFETETDVLVLQETTAFLVDVADAPGTELFDLILDALKKIIVTERTEVAAAMQTKQARPALDATEPQSYQTSGSLSNVVARGYVQMFMHSMNTDIVKARKTFLGLVNIAKSSKCESDARLTAMKLLFRLRADWNHRIYVTSITDSDGLAASLYRTEASLARKLEENAAQPPRMARPETRPSRGVSFTTNDRVPPARTNSTATGARAHIQHQRRLWTLPDSDSLPETPSHTASTVSFSHLDSANEGSSSEKKALLNMAIWLDGLLSILQQGCDWEVYSFVLVHLPSQLSNHPIFEDHVAIAKVQELRKLICDMLRNNSYQEPPSSTGLRKSDVGNCLFQSVATLVSYHPYFRKGDEDDIIRILTNGLSDKTAKTCIHALSVCCHEIPNSIRASLVPILHKMSQVITQPFVAMHILEFLVCLSRLHHLYSNFREDEYRIVFGIAFRYLQYVRDKKRSSTRHNSAPESPAVVPSAANPMEQNSATDDLPQYVYALAYHVVTFWFLALRINDRPNHIGWIAKNLFTDVDGSISNEEQAQITMDFMQRVAYSDAADSMEDPLFKEEFYGEVLRKRWIIGNSIVTIRQSKESGWAEITRRYPSGMSSFSVRERFAPVSSHQVTTTSSDAARGLVTGDATTPAHILLQLLAPIPQSFDPATRPIPLPADDAVDRAIRLFDLNSTVDGHKVGVIYIGENQTNEVEILANTVGSPEYNSFLRGLGTLTPLKGATFNAHGLDRQMDTDGKYTFCWRDRVTEIIYHVTTQMPTNLEMDPQCAMKKRHIGNDFVNIIFNNSGLPFKFDTLPSDFNYVNIVITPNPRPTFIASRDTAAKAQDDESERTFSPSYLPFFTVQVMSKPGFPEISPAAEPKTVSLKALPGFVRLLALNASVFSHVWANRGGGEFVSSWRARLRDINRLRERYGPKFAPVPSPPTTSMGGAPSSSLLTVTSVGHNQLGQHDEAGVASRPVSGVRDSLTNSLRRSSVATFFSGVSTDPMSHRTSVMSATTAGDTEMIGPAGGFGAADTLVESVDFSKWT